MQTIMPQENIVRRVEMAGTKEKGPELGRKSSGGKEENNNSLASPRVEQRVTVRWVDGLLYPGRVLKVDKQAGSYLVQMANDIKGWVLAKDIQKKGRKSGSKTNRKVLGEITCSICQGEESVIPNEIVLCDHCGSGFHQECHNPSIPTDVLSPGVPWLCRQCIFAAAAKEGGATKKGPNAVALQSMKQSLPYDVTSLDWDEAHKENKQEKYCYCGGPGQWYKKMLQCCRCKQWFHEACIQCLKYPLLYGDRFYIFVCSLCNSGPEFIQRMELRWFDLVQIAVFNLTVMNVTKYYDYEETIVPWIESNSTKLQTSKKLGPKAKWSEKILHVLQHHKSTFRNGKEIKKRNSLYGLRVRVPPAIPSFLVPQSGTVTAELMANIAESGIKTSTVVPDNSVVPIPLTTFKRKASGQPGDFARIVKRAKKLVHQSATSKGKHQIRKPKTHKALNGHIAKRTTAGDKHPSGSKAHTEIKAKESPSPRKTSLEAIIPRLSSYEGLNHPFKTVLERNQEIEHRKMKDLLLSSYTNGVGYEDLESDPGQTDSETASDAASSSTNTTDIASANVQGKQQPGYFVHRKKRGRMSRAEIAYMNAVVSRGKTEQQSTAPRRGRVLPPRKNSQNVIDKNTLDGMNKQEVSITQLKQSVNSYFGAANRLAYGERFDVLARRVDSDGKVQYLVEWEGGVIG